LTVSGQEKRFELLSARLRRGPGVFRSLAGDHGPPSPELRPSAEGCTSATDRRRAARLRQRQR
jgi:hypothetical protein